jgi:hypothetical protein
MRRLGGVSYERRFRQDKPKPLTLGDFERILTLANTGKHLTANDIHPHLNLEKPPPGLQLLGKSGSF